MSSAPLPDDTPPAQDGPPTFTLPLRLSSSLLACLVGFASALGSLHRLDPVVAALTALAVLLGHFGLSGLDPAGNDARSGNQDTPSISRRSPLGIYAPLTLAFLAALGLSLRTGSWLPVLAAASALSLGAWRAASSLLRGRGEALAAICWLLIAFTADALQRGAFSPLAAAAGLSYALLASNQHLIAAFASHARDDQGGQRTLVTMLGTATAKWVYLLIALFAYGWLVALVARYQLPQHAATAALTLVFSFAAGRELLEHADDAAHLGPAIRRTILAAHLHGLILAATLAFGRWPA
ncbi:prenyltransferase [Azoarcus indigens]|uniref:1,4-dihydroxy-2-naphthoate octaprenyltransferase n=1 Tax=Azoarcus indigens TaxID=29545 RepID=A0A4R6DU01_9RHOO|nr:prenyltransferase [Azoarcus indigens]NMG65828.1 prenyltransferase [Azoarcus indigens]TDN48641.1 1,4-dihydroxy-2-naphthoate octaprenyltransferase [Azoarcus indigens]